MSVPAGHCGKHIQRGYKEVCVMGSTGGFQVGGGE